MPSLMTQLIHAGQHHIEGAVTTPVFQSSTYTIDGGPSAYDDVRYVRLSNSPNHTVLAERLAAAEGAEAAVVTASGMAAVSTVLLSQLSAGDHLLAQKTLYGGTATLIVRELSRLGISSTFIDADRPDTWAAAVRPETRLVCAESVANPLMTVGRLDDLAGFAREHGLVSVIDNTFLSPACFQPLSVGFDIVVHSATKYLNGHSDVGAGAIAGSAAHVAAARGVLGHLGGSLNPHGCFLLERGLKTLALRMRQHTENATRLAAFLASHPAVAAVSYPGLPGSPGHAVAARLFSGCGGMLSFVPCGDALALIGRLRLATHAPSLGGLETLVVRPATSSHAGMSPAQRSEAGISDDLIRVSVGIEDPDDIVADFEAALG